MLREKRRFSDGFFGDMKIKKELSKNADCFIYTFYKVAIIFYNRRKFEPQFEKIFFCCDWVNCVVTERALPINNCLRNKNVKSGFYLTIKIKKKNVRTYIGIIDIVWVAAALSVDHISQ